MKRTVIMALLMGISTMLYAQETELTIDNQTPGWLSSKLTYSEQVTVKKLTLKGYINKADMDFINSLIRTRNLESLDLYEVVLINENNQDYKIWPEFLDYGDYKVLKKIIFPKRMEMDKSEIRICVYGTKIDTLATICKNQNIKYGSASYIELLEGSDTIPELTFGSRNTAKIAPLPKSLKVIEPRAFSGNYIFDEPFVFPKGIIRLGSNTIENPFGSRHSWFSTSRIDDRTKYQMPISHTRFDFPDSLIIYNSAVMISSGYSSYWQDTSKDIYESDTITVGQKCRMMYAQLKANVAIFYSKYPPSQFNGDFKIGVLYVPEGSASLYKEQYTTYTGNEIGQIKEMKSITSISISPKSVSLYIGETQKLNATIYPSDAFDKTFYWISSNDSIATIDDNGKVTGIKAGTVTISAVSNNGKVWGTCEINVLQHVTGVSLNVSEIEMNKIGETYQLEATVYPTNAFNQKINWLSSNLGICHVTSNGKLTATGFGSAVVFATSEDGDYTASCIVHVVDTSSSSEIHEPNNDLFISDGHIIINNGHTENEIVVYSTTGNIIYKGKSNNIKLQSGIYIIKIGAKKYIIKI